MPAMPSLRLFGIRILRGRGHPLFAAGWIDLDVTRPRIGRPLQAQAAASEEPAPAFTCAWRRAGTDKRYADEPFATTDSYTPTADDLKHWIKFTATRASSSPRATNSGSRRTTVR